MTAVAAAEAGVSPDICQVFFCNLAKIWGPENILSDIRSSWNFLELLLMSRKHCKKVWTATNFVNIRTTLSRSRKLGVTQLCITGWLFFITNKGRSIASLVRFYSSLASLVCSYRDFGRLQRPLSSLGEEVKIMVTLASAVVDIIMYKVHWHNNVQCTSRHNNVQCTLT